VTSLSHRRPGSRHSIMTETQQIDFTMMYVTHDALRRGCSPFRQGGGRASGRVARRPRRLGELQSSAASPPTVEDDDLWPRCIAPWATSRQLAMLEEMEASMAFSTRCSSP